MFCNGKFWWNDKSLTCTRSVEAYKFQCMFTCYCSQYLYSLTWFPKNGGTHLSNPFFFSQLGIQLATQVQTWKYVCLLGLDILLFYVKVLFICVGETGIFIQTVFPKSSKITCYASQYSKTPKSHCLAIPLKT